MCRLQRLAPLAVALSGVGLAGCDPGYNYHLEGANGQVVPEWTTTIDGVRFSVAPFSILIGSSNEFMGLGISNGSKDDVEVVGAEVETNGRTLRANLFPGPEGKADRTVPAGETRQVSLLVELGGAASETLGSSITWVWHVRIGSAEHTLRVPLSR